MFTNHGLLQIFFSLLLVISIMFVSNYYVYKNSISGIYDKVSENNSLVVKSIIQSFDNTFQTINNLIYSIHALPPNDSLISPRDGKADMTKVYTMVDHLSALSASMDYVEDVIVFYNNSELGITPTGSATTELLLNKKYVHPVYNESYWRTYVRNKNSLKYFPAEEFKIHSELNAQSNKKKLLVAVGGNKLTMSSKNVMLLIDVEKLMKHVDQKTMIPGASLIVLDERRNVILSTDDDLDLIDVLNDVYFNSTDQASVTRGDYEYNVYKSDYNDYIYIDKVPYQFQNIDSVARANHMIMWIGIVSAIILSAFLSVYLNYPVKKILRLLGGGHSRGNDFRKIHSGIVKLQQENEARQQELCKADVELQKGVFLQALHGHGNTKERSVQLQKHIPAFFESPFFVLLLLTCRTSEEGLQAPLSQAEINEQLRREWKTEDWGVLVFPAGSNKFYALVSMGSSSDREKLFRLLQTTFSSKDEGTEAWDWVCVSRLYTTETENIHRAYRDAQSGLEYRQVHADRRLMDVETIHTDWNLYLPLENMEKLTNYLMSGKVNEGIEVIQEILKENTARRIRQHQLVHIAKTMFIYMLKSGNQGPSHEAFQLERDFDLMVRHAHDVREVEKALIGIAKQVASENKQEQASKLNPAAISAYMDKHYMDNLYLDHIAEVFQTSPKYFSSYFKKTFGVNYVEYLNKVRLSHARELIRDTELSLAEIGEKVGYLNSSTFTTTFKKYYGISPSEYRKQEEGE